MRYQIQVRGDGSGAEDWRPVPRITGDATTFSSWDEAEEELDRLQLSGVLPLDVDGAGIQLRIVDLGERRRQRRAEGAPTREGLVRSGAAA
jgi:hypothetical protein